MVLQIVNDFKLNQQLLIFNVTVTMNILEHTVGI